jgi:hypothetical protein
MRIPPIHELWFSHDTAEWNGALHRYWALVQPQNVALEQAMERLDRERIRQMSPDEWFTFLHDEYFRWKYTARNRYATTTSVLQRKGGSPLGRQDLNRIKAQILALDSASIRVAIDLASQIPGLGTAGASGLLALLYPDGFGTVDQFVVKALREIPELPEASVVARMNPEGLTSRDGENLINIMRRQATVLTQSLGTKWRPRDLDKVLWTYGRKTPTSGSRELGLECDPLSSREPCH